MASDRTFLQNLERGIKRVLYAILGTIMRTRTLDRPLPLDKVSSILILRYDRLGDVVVTTPLWRALKARKPDITVGVAGSPTNADLLRSDPDVDKVFLLGRRTNKLFWRELFRARKTKWDMVVNLVYDEKTRAGIIAWLISPRAYRITIVHDRFHLYKRIYAAVDRRPLNEELVPMAEQILRTVEAGIDIKFTSSEKNLSLYIDESIDQKVSEEIKVLLKQTGTSWFIHINTSAGAPEREWGLEKYWSLSELLYQRYPKAFILWTITHSRETELRMFLETHRLDRVRLFTTATPQHLVAMIRHAALVYSPDTSVIHIASAEKRPIVGLYLFKNEFLPYRTPNIVLTSTDGKVISTIPVDEAFRAIQELILQTGEPASEDHAQSKYVRSIEIV